MASDSLHTPLSSLEDGSSQKNIIEGQLHEFLDELCTVAIQSRNHISQKWPSFLRYAGGIQWPDRIPDHRVDFTINLVGATLKRKAAYLTDTKPIIEVSPKDPNLKPVAEILQALIRNIWDERAVLSALTRSLYMAQIFGSAPMNLCWNSDLDFGNGEIDFSPWDTRHFLMDPGVVASENLQQAEYIILESVQSLNYLQYEYSDIANSIKGDPKYSKYSTYTQDGDLGSSSLSSPGGMGTKRTLKFGNLDLRDSSIPRVVVQELWVRDRVRMGQLPNNIQEDINRKLEEMDLSPKRKDDMVFPGGRHIIRAGGKILRDGSNPYWDLQWPCEMMSWGMEIEHPWGKSEVEEMMKINRIINKIGGSMVENTILMSNSIWIGDSNALTPDQWSQLNSKPGLKIKKRPNSTLERVAAPALPGSTFALQQWLVQMMQDLTGMVDVLQGKAGNQTTGVALEALQNQAQALLRLQARNMEVFLERIGQKLISRIFQFYSPSKIINILGPDPKLLNFEFKRDEFMAQLSGLDPRRAFQDFIFKIEPLSSLTMSKMQKLISMSNLYSMGLVPGKDVLKAAQILDPEHTLEEARVEQAAKLAPSGSAIKTDMPPGPPQKNPGPGAS